MITVGIRPEFVLAAAKSEMDKAGRASAELSRLKDIGYINSQIGLDAANEVKAHLTKACELLDIVDFPGVRETQIGIRHTIAQQNLIIRMIELSL